MQGWLEPRGPLGPRVYWIRRVGVVAVVVVLVVVLGRLISRGSSQSVISATPSPTPTSSASTTPTPAQRDEPSADPSTEQAGTGTPGSTPSTEQTPTDGLSVPVATAPPPPPACTAEMLTATISGTEDLKVTDTQNFTVTMVSTTDCALDLAVIGAKVEVTSGADAIWSTATCPQWAPTGTWDLLATEPVTFDVGWAVRRGHDCELSGDQLLPGTYVATVTVGDSGKFVMRLTA